MPTGLPGRDREFRPVSGGFAVLEVVGRFEPVGIDFAVEDRRFRSHFRRRVRLQLLDRLRGREGPIDAGRYAVGVARDDAVVVGRDRAQPADVDRERRVSVRHPCVVAGRGAGRLFAAVRRGRPVFEVVVGIEARPVEGRFEFRARPCDVRRRTGSKEVDVVRRDRPVGAPGDGLGGAAADDEAVVIGRLVRSPRQDRVDRLRTR